MTEKKKEPPTIECPHCDTKMEAGKGCCKVKCPTCKTVVAGCHK